MGRPILDKGGSNGAPEIGTRHTCRFSSIGMVRWPLGRPILDKGGSNGAPDIGTREAPGLP